jgi:hypothetical protein
MWCYIIIVRLFIKLQDVDALKIYTGLSLQKLKHHYNLQFTILGNCCSSCIVCDVAPRYILSN